MEDDAYKRQESVDREKLIKSNSKQSSLKQPNNLSKKYPHPETDPTLVQVEPITPTNPATSTNTSAVITTTNNNNIATAGVDESNVDNDAHRPQQQENNNNSQKDKMNDGENDNHKLNNKNNNETTEPEIRPEVSVNIMNSKQSIIDHRLSVGSVSSIHSTSTPPTKQHNNLGFVLILL